MNDEIEKLFIVESEYSIEDARAFAGRALKHGRVTKDGGVVIDSTNLSKNDQIKLCLVVRFIGHSFDETISACVRPVELENVLGQRVESVGALLSRLASSGFAKKAKRGEYSVHPYNIEQFLDEIDGVHTEKAKRKTHFKKINKKSKPFSGIGADIQNLIENDFFKNPKFISEVKERLEEENKFYDARVIDSTVRNTFVESKKTLKRIKNQDKSRAKWKYLER